MPYMFDLKENSLAINDTGNYFFFLFQPHNGIKSNDEYWCFM